MKGTITGALTAIALCAAVASAQSTSTQTRTRTGRHRTETTTKTTNTRYTGCLAGSEGSWTLATTGANPMTYTVVAAPGNTVDFSTDVNKRVEIVTMATPSGNTTTTTTRTTTNAPEGAAMNPSDAHTLTVQSIRVLPGSCSGSSTTTTTKSKTETQTSPKPY